MSSSSSTTSTRGSRVKPLTTARVEPVPFRRMKRPGVEGRRTSMATRTSSSSKRKPAARRPPNGAKRMPSGRARRSRKRRKGGLPQLEQRHLDLLGLALVALAVFLGFVIYRDRDGGEAGRRAGEGLEWLLGDMTHAVPPA